MRRRDWLLAVCLMTGALFASEADRIRFARIRSHMSDNLDRLPNFTCTETIERSERAARSRRFQLLDTLRLEVAMVNGKELFAWPGSGKFDDREMSEIIGGGTSGNGNFGIHARAIFLGGSARFEYLSEVEREEGRVFRYSYSVPKMWSGYMIKSGPAKGIAGYHGYFEADTETLDVLLLDVMADEEIPPELQILQAFTRMRYRRMKIGEGEFLLPESSEISLTGYSGTENRNRVHLSGCKQYGTESTIRFDDPPPTEATPAAAAAHRAAAPNAAIGELPVGLAFDAELLTRLQFPGAAVGDLVEARVTSDAKLKGAVMIPKGTVVRGRLLQVGRPRFVTRVETAAILIRLHEIDLPGGRAEIKGAAEAVPTMGGGGIRYSVDDNGVIYIQSGTRRELMRGSRIRWRLQQKTENEVAR